MTDYGDIAYALAGHYPKPNPHDAHRNFGYALLQSGRDASPIQSPRQGAARLAQVLAGGWAVNQGNEEDAAAANRRGAAVMRALAASLMRVGG